jgi:hypothetical protein
MSKTLSVADQLSIAQRIKSLKPGKSFTVKTEPERQEACRLAKALKDMEYITFSIVTKKEGNLFKVAAI